MHIIKKSDVYLSSLFQPLIFLLSDNTINHCISSFLKMFMAYASTHTYKHVCMCTYKYIYCVLKIYVSGNTLTVLNLYSLIIITYVTHLKDIFLLAQIYLILFYGDIQDGAIVDLQLWAQSLFWDFPYEPTFPQPVVLNYVSILSFN